MLGFSTNSVGEGLAPPENKGKDFVLDRGRTLNLYDLLQNASNRLWREEQAPSLPGVRSLLRSRNTPLNINFSPSIPKNVQEKSASGDARLVFGVDFDVI